MTFDKDTRPAISAPLRRVVSNARDAVMIMNIETDAMLSRPPAYYQEETEEAAVEAQQTNTEETEQTETNVALTESEIRAQSESLAPNTQIVTPITVIEGSVYTEDTPAEQIPTEETEVFIEPQEYIPPNRNLNYEPVIEQSVINEHEELKEDTAIQSEDKSKIRYLVNTRALPKHAKTYQLETFKKNAMIIFNHENPEGYSKRLGTAEDVAALCQTFEKFGFEIAVHNDLTKVRLFEELKKFSDQDFTEYGCVAVVILTHGTGNGLLRANDEGQLYSEMDIINQFKVRNKPTLLTKPVLVMIQVCLPSGHRHIFLMVTENSDDDKACRGKNSTRGVSVMQQYRIDTDHDEEFFSYYLPVESDMLIVHSSFAGKPSFRPMSGSWFIQTMCSHIRDLSKTHDLESIVTEVKRDVAINKHSISDSDVNKQMPVVTSTLIRKLFLKKYEEAAPKLLTICDRFQRRKNYDEVDSSKAHPGSDSCACFLYQFDYMKNCLRNYIDDHPDDAVARSILSLADLEDGLNEEKTKLVLTTISNYLQKHCKKSDYYKYIYFYEITDANETEFVNKQTVGISYVERIKKYCIQLSQNHAATILGLCFCAIIYKFIFE